ncbi:hypothetical protein HAX54_030661 [Datura stramonium]|uniref:Uncharacterized protein n=1 Tax=Datura stramonium TaxID=4076 RepID=A0ABS8VAU3_DATST|nr:hypothetical protein [Datura stramonium]
MGEVKNRHTFDGGSDGRQPSDGLSLGYPRYGPLISWATEVPTHCQLSDGLSWKLSPKPRFSNLLFEPDSGDDEPLRLRWLITPTITWGKVLGNDSWRYGECVHRARSLKLHRIEEDLGSGSWETSCVLTKIIVQQ